MGLGSFLSDVGDGIAKGLERATEAMNVVDRYIDPFHEEQQFTPSGKRAAEEAAKSGNPQNTGIFVPQLEQTMAGMHWLYSNGISQPLATALLMGKKGRRNNDDFLGFDSDYFSGSNWGKAWDAAEHLSPGQAFSLNPEEAQRAVDSPLLYYKPADAYLPPGFNDLPEEEQQKLLKGADMPAIGNAYIEQRRQNSGWFKYGTGAIDFGTVMFMDPTVLIGRGVSETYRGAVTLKRPVTGWSPADIDAMMAKGRTQKLMEGIWANKDNPQLLNETAMARHSAMGPRFGAIASTLTSPEEVNLFVRTGMGDVRAMEELSSRNAAAAGRMRNDTARLSALDLMHTRYSNFPAQQALVEMEMKRLTATKNADATLIQRYDEILRNKDQLDELNVSRWAMTQARERTEAANTYRAGGAKFSGAPVTIRPGAPVLSRTSFVPRTPFSTGYSHSTLWGAGDFFSGPLTMIRSTKEAHPNGYMRIDTLDPDSIAELRGHLARIPGMREEVRGEYLNRYLKTATETERKSLLEEVGRVGAASVARKHGFEPEYGMEIYRKHTKLRQGEVDNMARYSAGTRSPEEVAAGQPLHIDEFTDQGGKVVLEPFTVTRLMNGHNFQDLGEMNKVLSRHGSALKALRVSHGNVRDAVEASADYLSYLWKFSSLFRLGYAPRVLGDDIAGQIARLGAVNMAMRVGIGTKNLFTNASRWVAKDAIAARQAMSLEGVKYANEEMTLLKAQMVPLERRLQAEALSRQNDLAVATRRLQAAQGRVAALDPADVSAKARATRTLAAQRGQQLQQAQRRAAAGASPGKTAQVKRWQDQHDYLGRYRDLSQRAADDYAQQQIKVRQGNQPINIDGQVWPAAFGGRDGEYHYAQISADDSVGNIFNTNKAILQGNFERSFDHGAKPISAAQDPAEHLKAWTHAINNQMMQDPLQRMMISGKIPTWEEGAAWMKNTAQGMAYRKRLPKMVQTDDFARSAMREVDQYLHLPEIRMKAMEDGGVTPQFLDEAVPLVARPDVHIGQVGQSQLHHASTLDRVVQKWFNFAATMPANTMSRHPLFNQLYQGHLKSIVATRAKAGVTQHTVEGVEDIARAARALALKDTRKLVFDIAHRSDAASALRFISPFFSATGESFQRWSRIIADKPQVAGYANTFFNAPLSLGAMQDMDGNQITPQGKSFDPATGKWRVVPKSERYIVTRVPKWVAESPLGKAFNITEAGGKLALSQNSMNVVTQGDPWFNPGVGPIVQIPVNEWVRDKPKDAETMRELGILPFGPATGSPVDRLLTQAAPKTLRDFITAFDTSDQRYQQIKLQITQRAVFEHANLGKPMLSAQQIADKTRNYWMFSASSAFLQPMATQRKDPYQFFRDQYNAMRRIDPKTADDQFLERYGESYFIFAQEITKSQGVPPTIKAVDLQKKWGALIAKSPELAPLVIGPDGDGPFSREAYAYELNHPLVPGGGEMMRSKMTADQAMKENKRRLGWAKFTKKMNGLTADLHKAGFSSFEDPGAESFLADKRAWTKVYSEPLYPDGTINPDYNDEWSKDFLTFDARKYDRMIPDLTRLVRSDLAKQPGRSDLRVLGEYLGGRQALMQQLSALKDAGEPSTLAAKKNAALRYQWVSFVDNLIESDTKFGDLHSRYLSRDMGVDAEAEAEEATQ